MRSGFSGSGSLEPSLEPLGNPCPALSGTETALQLVLLSGIRRKRLNSSSSEGGSGNLEGNSVIILPAGEEMD